jgi:hypothetical protein
MASNENGWKRVCSFVAITLGGGSFQKSIVVLNFQILAIRSVHHQLIRLLWHEDIAEAETTLQQCFQVFHGISLLDNNVYTEKQWTVILYDSEREREKISKNASTLFYNKLEALQARVAGRLAQHFAALRNQPFQLLHEFQRYGQVLKLERVKKELGNFTRILEFSQQCIPCSPRARNTDC